MQIDSLRQINPSPLVDAPVSSLTTFALKLKNLSKVALAIISAIGLLYVGFQLITWYWNRCSVLVESAKNLIKQNDLPKAKLQLDEALKIDPKHVPTLVCYASVMNVEGKSVEAEGFYKMALKIDPNHFDAIFSYAEFLFNNKRPFDAYPFYVRANKLRPDHTEMLKQYGNVAIQIDHLDEGIACYKKVLEKFPDDLQILKICGDTLRRRLKYVEAEKLLKRALELEGDHKTCFTLSCYAETLRRLGRLEESAAHFLQAMASNPDDLFTLTRYADTLRLQGKFDDAFVVVNGALRIAPADAIAMTCYHKIQLLRRQINPFPDLLDGVREDAKTLLQQGQYHAAECQYVYLVTVDKEQGNADTLMHYGETLRNLKKHKEADFYFQRALRILPNDLYTLSRYAANLFALGQYTQALENYSKALKYSPKDPFSLKGKVATEKKLEELKPIIRK